VTLTPDNYPWLVGNSDGIWLIQVYDSTNKYCHYFASEWEQIAKEYRGLVNLGRIDSWQQTDMKGYVPYRFQLHPGIYTMHQGQDRLCSFDFDRPYRSLELCVEDLLAEITIPKVDH
jgi:hypothetical protein